MYRRTLLSTLSLGTLGLAGCLGDDSGGVGADTDDSSTDTATPETPYPDLSTAQREFLTTLDEELAVASASATDDTLVVTVQTTGQRAEDRQLAAEVYANFIGRLETDLRVRVEDRGLGESTFVIRADWAEGYVNDEIDANAYLDRIDDTTSE